MQEYILYGTLGCHLCELAEQLLIQLKIPFIKVDIAESDAMVARLGERIPVLSSTLHPQGPQLNWPFDQKILLEWLHQQSSPKAST